MSTLCSIRLLNLGIAALDISIPERESHVKGVEMLVGKPLKKTNLGLVQSFLNPKRQDSNSNRNKSYINETVSGAEACEDFMPDRTRPPTK